MTTYNTNLASEYYVLSMLHRLGADAALTLGNKKAVDILVASGEQILTVEVKGVAKPYDWPADNIHILDNPHHFYVLICFEGKISNPLSLPSAWIIPARDLSLFLCKYKTRTVVSRKLIKERGEKFFNAWEFLAASVEDKA